MVRTAIIYCLCIKYIGDKQTFGSHGNEIFHGHQGVTVGHQYSHKFSDILCILCQISALATWYVLQGGLTSNIFGYSDNPTISQSNQYQIDVV